MGYTTVFKSPTPGGQDAWHEGASVRSRMRIQVSVGDVARTCLFSPALIPAIEHPIIRRAGTAQQLQLEAWRLIDYLSKTERVELDVVNAAIRLILQLPHVPEAMHIDALKVYTDEGYHVVMLLELRQQLEQNFNVDLSMRPSESIDRLFEKVQHLPAGVQEFSTICLAVVAETLITSTLTQARDSRLVHAVERFLTDHANDESKHHAFFSAFALKFLGDATEAERRLVAELVPEIIFDLLDPNLAAIANDVQLLGHSKETAWRIVTESFNPEKLRQAMLSASRAPRRLLEQVGIGISGAFHQRVREHDFFRH